MKNWKTTLAGSASAVLNLWVEGGFDGTNPKAWVAAFALALAGFVAKDAGVEGKGL